MISLANRHGWTAIHIALVAVMLWLSWLFLADPEILTIPTWIAFAHYGNRFDWTILFVVTTAVGTMGLVTDKPWIGLVSVFVLATAHGLLAMFFLIGRYEFGQLNAASGIYAIFASLGYTLCTARFLKVA